MRNRRAVSFGSYARRPSKGLAAILVIACIAWLRSLSAAFAVSLEQTHYTLAPRFGFAGVLKNTAQAPDGNPQVMRASSEAAAAAGEAKAPSMPLLATVPLLLYLVVNWAGSAELLQIAQHGYPNPFVLTVIGALAPLSAVPVLLAYDMIRGVSLKRSARELGEGFRKLVKSSGVFAALHLGVEFLWISSLGGTSVGTNTAIYNTYLVFVCIGSVVLGLEKLTRQKTAGVALGLSGLALIWRAQSAVVSGTRDTPWGVSLCLLSTLCFSAYQLFCDVCGGEESVKVPGPPLRSQLLWTSALGVISCAIVAAVTVVVAAFGYPLPVLTLPSAKVALCMTAVVLMQMTYQLGLFVAISATSALLVAGGSVTVIPTGFAFDFLMHGIVPSAASAAASAFIIAGFVLLLRASMAERKQQPVLA